MEESVSILLVIVPVVVMLCMLAVPLFLLGVVIAVFIACVHKFGFPGSGIPQKELDDLYGESKGAGACR